MSRLLSICLILMTLWMSTWLVTDIHVAYAQEGYVPHPVFSLQGKDNGGKADHPGGDRSGCHFCSYDHGGHVGALALPVDAAPALEPPPTIAFFFYQPRFFLLNRPPRHRPPIA